jgi:hypothetical protein
LADAQPNPDEPVPTVKPPSAVASILLSPVKTEAPPSHPLPSSFSVLKGVLRNHLPTQSSTAAVDSPLEQSLHLPSRGPRYPNHYLLPQQPTTCGLRPSFSRRPSLATRQSTPLSRPLHQSSQPTNPCSTQSATSHPLRNCGSGREAEAEVVAAVVVAAVVRLDRLAHLDHLAHQAHQDQGHPARRDRKCNVSLPPLLS